MKDRYLFKGKRLDNGQWVKGNLLKDGLTGQVFIHRIGNPVGETGGVGMEGWLQFLAFEIDPSTVCQCTGVKDKNGKLIWENDILREEAELSTTSESQYYIHKVYWDEAMLSFYCGEIYSEEELPLTEVWQGEVIGNTIDHSIEDLKYWKEISKR